MNTSFNRSDLITLELIGVLLLHLGELVIRFPCNHANAMMFSYMDCIFALALFEIVYSIFKRRVCLAFWIIFAISLCIPRIEDKCNILIPYETWIKRDMPEWGHPSSMFDNQQSSPLETHKQ